ncbi:MAG: sugar ABC transporter substrate-binding protein [Epulopiscium sp.]|nr:sugar ABC transporter substrate-binding protein [Candidatus Epulonipiscium sp.]
MMKNKYYTTIVFVLVLLLLSTTGLIFFRINNALNKVEQNTGIIVPDQIPDYHFAMIYQDVDDSVWFSIKKGVEKAAKAFNVAVEFNSSSTVNGYEMLKYLDIAVASKVDGIITYVWDEEQISPLIDRAVNQGIPVITIGRDVKESNRTAFIGVNTYDYGIQLGRMIVAATRGQGEVAIVDDSDPKGEVIVQNLMILGIRDAIKQYPDIHISSIEYNNEEFLGIEDVVNDLLQNNSKISTIVCTSEKDTTIIAERLIDLNKVGYNIIGYGDSSELLRYIEKGVVFGTVTADLEKMGYDTIEAMVDIKQHGRTSAYFTVDTFLITKNNVSEYLNIGEE